MPDGIRWVGLDVHARESTFAIFDQAGEVDDEAGDGSPARAAAVAASRGAAGTDGLRGRADRVRARASRAGGRD